MAVFVAVEVRLKSGEAHSAQTLAGLKSGEVHSDRALAVGVRQGPLRSRADSGGPARPTAIES